MSRAYSLDLRERVVRAVGLGGSCRAVAATFGVSVASVVRWAQRHRATGSPAARRPGGSRPRALVGQREWLLARIAEAPDLTLRGLLGELVARGVAVSYYAVWHFFEREGYSFKKKPARQRTRAPGRGAAASPVATVSGPGRSAPSRVHR